MLLFGDWAFVTIFVFDENFELMLDIQELRRPVELANDGFCSLAVLIEVCRGEPSLSELTW